MGMAASQARFLSLTARKSNVEYEGQQVNQQRTALANESANLYNKLTSIDVPTPPTTSDYYETVYTFTTSELDSTSQSGSTEYTLNNIYSAPDGLYANLSYTSYQWESALTRAYSGLIDPVTDAETGETSYSVNLANGSTYDAVEYHYEPSQTELTFTPSEGSVNIGGVEFTFDQYGRTISGGVDSAGQPYTYDVVDNGDGTYTMTLTVQKEEENQDNYTVNIGGTVLNLEYDPSTGTYIVPSLSGIDASEVSGRYVDESGKSNSAVSYLSPEFTGANGLQNQPILAYNIGNQTYFISAEEFQSGEFASSSFVQSVGHLQTVDYPCEYTTAATGRYQTLTVTDEYGTQHTFSLEVQTVQDEEAYNQAMLDYEYQQAAYEKEVADINARTEELQQQDRTLELRLRQLDTEQNAIATEMDAVSKVIEDNIESTFKTFA